MDDNYTVRTVTRRFYTPFGVTWFGKTTEEGKPRFARFLYALRREVVRNGVAGARRRGRPFLYALRREVVRNAGGMYRELYVGRALFLYALRREVVRNLPLRLPAPDRRVSIRPSA